VDATSAKRLVSLKLQKSLKVSVSSTPSFCRSLTAIVPGGSGQERSMPETDNQQRCAFRAIQFRGHRRKNSCVASCLRTNSCHFGRVLTVNPRIVDFDPRHPSSRCRPLLHWEIAALLKTSPAYLQNLIFQTCAHHPPYRLAGQRRCVILSTPVLDS
jgi:hypothetical protein